MNSLSKVNTTYDASSIQKLEGLEGIRKRPGMYIGGTDENALAHLVYEVADNSVDEFLAGHGTEIHITFTDDGRCQVRDFARGIPAIGKKGKKNILDTLLTELHAGGKFGGDDSGYRVSGGLHGIGLKATNATSKYMKVVSYKDGYEHFIEYENGGQLKTPVNEKQTKANQTSETGTFVEFIPDPDIFDNVEFNKQKIIERFKERAFLTKGLKFIIVDERDNTSTEVVYERGVEEYLETVNKDKKHITGIGMFEGTSHDIQVSVAVQWVEGFNDVILAFANNVRNNAHGTHVQGFRAGILKAINRYAKEKGVLKAKDPQFQTRDVAEGINAIVSVLVPEEQLQFNSQTKDALNTPNAKNAVETVLDTQVYEYLISHKKDADKLMTKIKHNQKSRLEAEQLRKKQKSLKNKKNLALDKLTPATGRANTENELFIVEGDSAAGSAKTGRDRKTQGILALRGKVLNTENASPSKALTNAEIQTLCEALNVDLAAEYDPKQLKYHKVIIMTDADTDGAHIQVLLLTLFFRHLKPLVDNGHIYIAKAPLFKITDKDNNKTYAWSQKERDMIIAKQFKNKEYTVGRFKGLGEMNPDELRETTMHVDSRRLQRVTVPDAVYSDELFNILMGTQAQKRKDWIESHVDLEAVD